MSNQHKHDSKYNSKLGNMDHIHSILQKSKSTSKNKGDVKVHSSHVRVWSRVFTNSKHGHNRIMGNSPKTMNVPDKKGDTYDSQIYQRLQPDTKQSVVNKSRARLANNQVVLKNTFAVIGDLVEAEIDEIIGPTSVPLQRGQGGREGSNQSQKTRADNTIIHRHHQLNKQGAKHQAEVMQSHDIPLIANRSLEMESNVYNDVIQDFIEAKHTGSTQNRVDVKNSVQITRAVLNGNNACIRHVNVLDIKDKCVDLKRCIAQQRNVFGFLPITNLKPMKIGHSLTPNKVLSHNNFDPVLTHKVVRHMGGKNFETAKIQLPSDINFELLDQLCANYWDYQLPYFLRYGFPLDFPQDKETRLQSTEVSHASAIRYPTHVDAYINIEIQHKAIFGPYADKPYGESSHVSPFMSREKNDSQNRRIIIDLSWPEEASINYFTLPNIYLGTVYQIRYPTVDDITDHILSLQGPVKLYKIDLSRAFRQLRIDPSDFNLLTLRWHDSYYADTFCPFGHRSGAMACTRVTDMFRYVMAQCDDVIFNYVDDLIGCGRPGEVEMAFQFLKNLLQKLGFPISVSKLVEPTVECHCLGILINTKECTLSLTAEKLSEIMDKCKHIMSCHHVTRRQLQSVIGSLMFLHKCV